MPAGTSVMRAAALADMKIPKLCATDQLEAFGSCRLCLVQIEGMKGFPASCTTPVAAGMKVTTQNGELAKLRRGVMELYISDHPLDCLTCPANGHCELQDMAGAVGLREVRYGYSGRQSPGCAEGRVQSVFHLRCQQVHRLFALRARLRRTAGHARADDRRARLRFEGVGQPGRVVPGFGVRLLRRLRAGLPDGDAVGEIADRAGPGRAQRRDDLRLLRRRLLVPRRDARRGSWSAWCRTRTATPTTATAACKGRFAIGYATHPDRITKPMIRARISDPWREVSWEEAIGHAASELRRIQAKYGRDSIGGITSSRCTNEETYLVQKLVRAGFGNNNVDTCARVCHSPTGYGLKPTLGESAGHADLRFGDGQRRHHGDRRQSDRCASGVRLADEAPAAPGRAADRRRSAPHRPGAHAAHRGRASPRAPARHQRRADQQPRARRRDRGAGQGGFRARALRSRSRSRNGATSSARRATRPRRWSRSPACRRKRCAAAARLYATARQRRDLLRSRRHRAQPGLDDGDGHRQSRDGHRQRRPFGRRRESAARAEQRAGLVRHGFVPARVPGLSPRRPTIRCARSSSGSGMSACWPSRDCASRTCSRPRSMASSRACTSRARTSRSPIRTRST